MPFDPVERLARALLYEGYLLYPYSPSAVKNQQRWTFGCLFPPAYGQASPHPEPAALQAECLLRCGPRTRLDIRARFLHQMTRTVSPYWQPGTPREGGPESPHRMGVSPRVGGRMVQTCQEAVERTLTVESPDLRELARRPYRFCFSFPASRVVEPLCAVEGMRTGVVIRAQQAVEGVLEASAELLRDDLYRLRLRLENHTPLPETEALTRDQALPFALLSCLLMFRADAGEFFSLLDPGEEWRAAAAACRNLGVWPVLVGELGRRDLMLAAPVILDDYPQIAEESPGDLFDGTEIDELLTLRIRTLTPEEKREMAELDPRARDLLLQSEAMPCCELLKLHGARRQEESLEATPEPVGGVRVGTVKLEPGMRVRVRPGGRADVFDLELAGRVAQVVSVEKDFEDRTYVSVALDDDPGKDFGLAGLPGHRFFFRPEELELLPDLRPREAER
jgi:hypothetical protein